MALLGLETGSRPYYIPSTAVSRFGLTHTLTLLPRHLTHAAFADLGGDGIGRRGSCRVQVASDDIHYCGSIRKSLTSGGTTGRSSGRSSCGTQS